jgi:hypothetical protein
MLIARTLCLTTHPRSVLWHSLLKLSSFPNGFIINNTEGITQLATTLTDLNIKNISAIITLTNAEKSVFE